MHPYNPGTGFTRATAQPQPNVSHNQAFTSRRQQIGAQNARQLHYEAPLFRCTTGIFSGQTIRAEVNEIQKADVGRKYAASKDRRALDPPPVAELRIYEVAEDDSRRVVEREVNYNHPSLAQPTGLICYIEVYAVAVNSSEEPSHVLDFPEKCPPAPSSRASVVDPHTVLAYWRGQPITSSNNRTTALVGDVFTQALNLPIAEDGDKNALLFVFPDVSLQLEGWFVLRYRVFDLFSVQEGSQPILAESWGRPFRIYATKQFPGLEPSTALTKLLHKNHVPVRFREVRRKRKRNTTKGGNDSEEDSDQERSTV